MSLERSHEARARDPREWGGLPSLSSSQLFVNKLCKSVSPLVLVFFFLLLLLFIIIGILSLEFWFSSTGLTQDDIFGKLFNWRVGFRTIFFLEKSTTDF